MIGLKLKNSVWEKALLSLLGNRAEVWQLKHQYSIVLTDLFGNELKKFQSHEKAQLIGLGKSKLPIVLSLPIKKADLEKVLAIQRSSFENKFFLWDEFSRCLVHKKTKKNFLLTEKENAILTYLSHRHCYQATKEELLQEVWHYTNGTETHTVESTIHTLRQKLGKYADYLIISTKTGYRLV